MWTINEDGALVLGGVAPSIEDTAPSEYWTPVEQVKSETEEEKQQRLWNAVVETARI